MYHTYEKIVKKAAVVFTLLAVWIFTACGRQQAVNTDSADKEPDSYEILYGEADGVSGAGDDNESAMTQGNSEPSASAESGTSSADFADAASQAATSSAETQRAADFKNTFGEYCIAEQTFEVELSEYSGKVWFVPFAPEKGGQDFHIQIIQDGEVLTEIKTYYVPEELESEKFGSLDAVSFYDVNYDDNTDIVLIETYGGISFAAVYYGYGDYVYGDKAFFISQSRLSENISKQVETLTIPNIRSFLSDGKKNGEFTGYQEAYKMVARLYELEWGDTGGREEYDLIYVNDDEIPELVAGLTDYYVSLYTYDNDSGKVYTLMDTWGYGAMGNVGYEYVPRMNSLRNYNTDFAGAIGYTTYMTVSQQYVIDVVVQIKTYNYDDVNGNGMPDQSEEYSMGYYSVSYIDDREITDEEAASYDLGEYEYIIGKMSFDELQSKLVQRSTNNRTNHAECFFECAG